MSGKVIKVLTNIRFGRSTSTSCQEKLTPGGSDNCQRIENEPSEPYVSRVEDYEERVAIMEFDGGMSREEAEKLARALM